MLVEREVGPYVVYADDPLLRALEKITDNRARVVFVVSEHGRLEGSLSDGDVRRWIGDQERPDLTRPAREAANTGVRSVEEHASPDRVRAQFGAGIDHVPLVDRRGRLVAVAVARDDTLRIGGHDVGPGRPTLVVSEIGINHQGSVAFAKELVERSVEAGADVVKFQLRDLDATYRQAAGGTAAEDLGPQYTLDLLGRYNLGADQLVEVFDHCRSTGVGVMCTAWDPPSVRRLAEYGVDGLKVASADLTNHGLLRQMAATGIPMMVSTGMSTEGEIRRSVAVLRDSGAAYSLLHCQSTYPAPYKDVNLRYLRRLADIGRCPVGYSGHERGFHVALAAVALGAAVIEKHFTTDRSLEGNDHQVSLLPGEFAEMVRRVREVEEAMGSAAPRSVSTGEMMNRVNLAKSLVAARPLRAGEPITADAVDVRSPGRGLQPDALDRLVGRTAGRALSVGDFFYAGDLEGGGARARRYAFRRPWGLPVRYHDAAALARASNPDFLEFHLSYQDLTVDPTERLEDLHDLGLAVHSPDLFAGDFLLNLASPDEAHRRRSVVELQRVVDLTRTLAERFHPGTEPVVIASLGGFTRDRHLPLSDLPALYERVAEGLALVDDAGVRLCAQTLPPYPWYLGGQLYGNLFVRPEDTAEFARAHGRRLVLDVSHTQLAATWLDQPFPEAVERLGPHVEHLHLVDATGIDGEGAQVGEGDVDWAVLAEQLDRLAPRAGFIPEVWQGHVNQGEGFWTALERLEEWF